MVTAGVYLVCRLHFVFLLSPFVMMVVALVGAFTAFYAATVALVQYDIKKVLAYSTVSQLGFMFLGVGVGAFSAGFFHVFTHAFFKACLFLGAGSVIHAMHKRVHDDDKAAGHAEHGRTPQIHAVDVPHVRGVDGGHHRRAFLERVLLEGRDPVPRVHRSALEPDVRAAQARGQRAVHAACVDLHGALRGLRRGGDDDGVLHVPLLLPHVLGRLPRLDDRPPVGPREDGEEEEAEEDLSVPGYPPHESPWQMTVPLIVLATGAAVAGILNMGLFHVTPIDHWLEPVFEAASKAAVKENPTPSARALLPRPWRVRHRDVRSLFALLRAQGRRGAGVHQGGDALHRGDDGILFIAIGAVLWGVVRGRRWLPALHRVRRLRGDWRVPRHVVPLRRPRQTVRRDGRSLIDALADTSAQFDRYFIDGVIAKLTAFVVAAGGTVLRAAQNGVVHLYAAIMVVGVAAIGWFFVIPHADASVAAKGSDFTVTTGASGGYLGYTFEWSQCEPDKKVWQKEWDGAMQVDDAKKRANEQRRVVEELVSKHARCEAPGDKWTAVYKETVARDGTKDSFGEVPEITLHLEADSDAIVEEARPVRLRARNVFSAALRNYAASTTVYVPRPAKVTSIEVGQNQ